MRSYFIEAPGIASERLKQAWPEAKFVESLYDLATVDRVGGDYIVWLFIRSEDDLSALADFSDAASAHKIIVLSNQPHAAEALNAFKAGARGYCHAQSAPAMFQQVAEIVLAGGVWVGQEFMPYLLRGVDLAVSADQPSKESDLHSLTAREREVVVEVCRGASNKEIAKELGITERTVKAHLTAVFEKLGIRDRVQLIVRYKNSSFDK